MTPSQSQGQWKWYKMVEVNDIYKHGKYENIWLDSSRVMSYVEVFATQDNSSDGHRRTQSITYP